MASVVVGFGIIAQNQTAATKSQKSPKRLVKGGQGGQAGRHKKKAPGGTLSDDIGQAIGSVSLGNCLSLPDLFSLNP